MIHEVEKQFISLSEIFWKMIEEERKKYQKEKKVRNPYYPPTQRRTVPQRISARGRRSHRVASVGRSDQQSDDDGGGGGDCGPCDKYCAKGAVFQNCTFYLAASAERLPNTEAYSTSAEGFSYMSREKWASLYIADPDPEWANMGVGVFDMFGLFDRNELEAPVLEIFKLLEISPQRFIDFLNAPRNSTEHLGTNYEPQFRRSPENEEFFTRGWIWGGSDITVQEEDFKTWLDSNYMYLKAWRKSEKELRKVVDSLQAQEIMEEIEAARCQTKEDSLEAENERLRARVAELENAAQKSAEKEEKTLATREKNTLLKLIHAAVELGGRHSISEAGLAGKLARKTEELYSDANVSERTVLNKIKEIGNLEK